MPFFAHLDSYGRVHTVSENPEPIEGGNIIPIDSFDESLLNKYYSKEKGFYSQVIVAQATKEEICIGENLEITFYWQDENGTPLSLETPFSVMVNGQEVLVPVGEVLTFSAQEPGQYLVETINPGVENTKLQVVVKDGES